MIKIIRTAHNEEIAAADYHLELNLIATGAFNGTIRLW